MDDNGFYGAAVAGLRIFDGASRASGRTTRLIESLHEGDVVLCQNAKSARFHEGMWRDHCRSLSAEPLRQLERQQPPKVLFVYPTEHEKDPLYAMVTRHMRRGHRVLVTHEFELLAYEKALDATRRVFQEVGVVQRERGYHPEQVEPVALRMRDV